MDLTNTGAYKALIQLHVHQLSTQIRVKKKNKPRNPFLRPASLPVVKDAVGEGRAKKSVWGRVCITAVFRDAPHGHTQVPYTFKTVLLSWTPHSHFPVPLYLCLQIFSYFMVKPPWLGFVLLHDLLFLPKESSFPRGIPGAATCCLIEVTSLLSSKSFCIRFPFPYATAIFLLLPFGGQTPPHQTDLWCSYICRT